MISEQKLLNTIDEAIYEVFSVTLSLDPKKETAIQLGSDGNDLIITSMGVSGTLHGNISIWISEKSACKLISKMLGMEIEKGSSDVLDGCGELLNMISGSIKNKLEGTDLQFELSIPQTIKGDQLTTAISTKTAIVKENYSVEDMQFQFNFIYQIEKENIEQEEAKTKTVSSAFDLLNKAIKSAEKDK